MAPLLWHPGRVGDGVPPDRRSSGAGAQPLSTWANYGVAAVLAGVGLLFALNAPWHSPGKGFIVLLVAVVLSTYLGG
ncbi:MAG TPA: hypothetical protein VKU60_02460, partial [Chloroflexota bacterium]|nr:hypothetical protein [Chloroflexota bacterium]